MTPPPRNILVSGVFGFQNRGDWALTLALFDTLRDAFPGCSIHALARDPQALQEFFPGVTFHRLPGASLRFAGVRRRMESALDFAYGFLRAELAIRTGIALTPLAKRILDADLVLAAPGGNFEDSNIGILMHAAPLWLALLAGKPVVLAPQSIGPLRSRLWRHLMSATLRRAALVCARELYSLQLARELCGSSHAHLVPDMSLFDDSADLAGAAKELADFGLDEIPFIAMTIATGGVPFYAGPRRAPEGHVDCLAGFCRRLQQDGVRVFVWLQAESAGGVTGDEDALARFGAIAPPNVTISKRRYSPALIRGILHHARCLLTSRMHPSLFAVQAGCPFISVSAERKTAGVLSMLRLQSQVLDITSITPASLYEGYILACANRPRFTAARNRASRLGQRGRSILTARLQRL